MSALKNDVVPIKPHGLELLKVVQVEEFLATLQEWHPLDGVFVEKSRELNFEWRRQHFEQVADVLLRAPLNAFVLLEVQQQTVDKLGADAKLFVELVHFANPLLVKLTRTCEIAKAG